MKISSIKPVSIYPKSDRGVSPMSKGRESAHSNITEKQNNLNQINTTIKMNSDGRASFKGGVPLLHRAAEFVKDSPLVAEALFALVITCGLRPLTIMATAKNEEEKEKCSYQAAKSVSSGLVGLAMTSIVGTTISQASKKAEARGAFKITPEIKEKATQVVKKGVDALKEYSAKLVSEGKEAELVKQIENLTEGGTLNLGYFAKHGKKAQKLFTEEISEKAPEILDTVTDAISNQKVINNYAKAGKNVIDKLFQPAFMPLRAMVTIALVPVILGLVGKKKPSKKQEVKPEANLQAALNYNVFQSQKEKELFGSFTGGLKNEN